MNETAAIISAIAGVIVALSGMVLSISRLGPVINAINKMLIDQHKRTMELKKSAKTATALPASIDTEESPPPLRRKPWLSIASIAVILSSLILIISQVFATEQMTGIVTCFLGAMTIGMVVMTQGMLVVFDMLFFIIKLQTTHNHYTA